MPKCVATSRSNEVYSIASDYITWTQSIGVASILSNWVVSIRSDTIV